MLWAERPVVNVNDRALSPQRAIVSGTDTGTDNGSGTDTGTDNGSGTDTGTDNGNGTDNGSDTDNGSGTDTGTDKGYPPYPLGVGGGYP